MKRDLTLFIDDIISAINDIQESSKNISGEKFSVNKDVKDATIRRLEIIGEAVKNIPIFIREKYSDVPWNKIAGMRDVITHGYFRVDLDSVWEVIRKDLPKLKKQIQRIKKDMTKNRS